MRSSLAIQNAVSGVLGGVKVQRVTGKFREPVVKPAPRCDAGAKPAEVSATPEAPNKWAGKWGTKDGGSGWERVPAENWSVRDVAGFFGVSSRTVRRMVEREPGFPRPVRVLGSIRWSVGEVRAWWERKLRERDGGSHK